MKILIVGSDKVYSIENFYVKHMLEAGVEVENFPAQRFFYDYYQQGTVRKLLFRAGLSQIIRQINERLLERVEQFKPDAIWVFKGMEVMPATLMKLRQRGIKLANYNPDNPFIFTGRGSGNAYITRSIPLYDLHFTYNLAIQAQLEKEYRVPTAYLPFGFELGDAEFNSYLGVEETIRACFLGNPDDQRAVFIQQLAEAGVEMDLFGHGWDRFVRHERLHIFNAVYREDFWRTLRRYRIQLNILRIHNEDSHNMRSFEVPGVGGIMIAPATTEHKIFFADGKDAFLFQDQAQCAEKMKYILGLSREEASRIRDQAREKSVNAGYTYRDRAQLAIKHLQNLHA